MSFNNFYYDTCTKLREIFTEHCNLSMEQYEWLSAEVIYLVSDIQDGEPQAEIEKRMEKLGVIFDFLMETKELTMEEHYRLTEMTGEIWEQQMKTVAEAAVSEGTVL